MGKRKRPPPRAPWEPRIASVWVGSFPDRSSAEAYFSEAGECDPSHPRLRPVPFLADFGIPQSFDLHAADGFAVDRPIPVGRLARNEWFAGQPFAGDVVAACRRLGIGAANVVVSVYGYRHPAMPGQVVGGAVFVGTFPCPPEAEPGAAADGGA